MQNLSNSNSLFFINAAKLIMAVEETRNTFKDRRAAQSAMSVHKIIIGQAIDMGLRLEYERHKRKLEKSV